MNDIDLAMLGSALSQVADVWLEKYNGPRDRDSLAESAGKVFDEKVAGALPELLEALELEPDDVDTEVARDMFVADILSRAVVHAPRGSHRAAPLEWKAFGPARAASVVTPPSAKRLDDYFIAYDPAQRTLVYALSPDYHQFGHAYALGSDGFTVVSKRTVRLGSAQQSWTGAYDADRGGIVGWNVDGEVPVGVLVRGGEVTALAPAGHRLFGDEPRDIVAVIDAPSIESDWDDLHAVFGHDPLRHVWVMLTPGGVFELGLDHRWVARGEVAEGVLPENISGGRLFGNGGAGAAWDAPRQRLVFWFANRGVLQLTAWDGKTMTPVSSEGLPKKPMSSFSSKGGAVVAAHPTRGVVIYIGGSGLYTLNADGSWQCESAGTDGPPKSRGASLAFAEDGRALHGPGDFAKAAAAKSGDDDDDEDDDDDDDDDAGQQSVFYVLENGAWTRVGNVVRKSALATVKTSGGWPVLSSARGVMRATSWRADLTTFEWNDGWKPVVAAAAGEASFAEGSPKGSSRAALLEGADGVLHAISDTGAVFRFVESERKWVSVAGDDDTFGKRRGFGAVYEATKDRFVVWGGGRGNDDTLFFEKGKWRRAKPGARPRDFKYSHDTHGFSVDFALTYDTALQRVVRLGFDEVAVLDGDSWRPLAPKHLNEHLAPSSRAFVHDPATGETLAVSFDTGHVVRIDITACDLVGAIAPLDQPEDSDDDDAEHPQALPFQDWVFDPKTRALYTFAKDNDDARFSIDLGPAFDTAKAMGARTTTLPPAPPPPVRLYRADGAHIQVFFADGEAGAVVIRTGRLGGDLVSERVAVSGDVAAELARLGRERAQGGYVTASALDRALVEKALGRPVYALDVADAEGDDADEDEDEDDDDDSGDDESAPRDVVATRSRLGGLPCGITQKEWPKVDGEYLGFLCQLELPGDVFDRGVLVFTKTDGTATEDEENTVTVVVPRAAFDAPPLTKAPKGVPVMEPRAITISARALEIDGAVAEALGADDGELASLIASIVGDDDRAFDKVGGYASWIQGGPAGTSVLAQIDFDGMSLDGDWEDAGLMGGLFVLDGGDGDASAMWQYT